MNEHDERKKRFSSRLYTYILRLIKFASQLPEKAVIREIVKQLIRSGMSIGANYFEAQAASSKKDYQNFFSHSLKSANETKFWLSLLLDAGFVPTALMKECQWLQQETEELAKIFASSIITMKGKRNI